jgi:hypothetical protein
MRADGFYDLKIPGADNATHYVLWQFSGPGPCSA